MEFEGRISARIEFTPDENDDVNSPDYYVPWSLVVDVIGAGWQASYVSEDPYHTSRSVWLSFLSAPPTKVDVCYGSGGIAATKRGAMLFHAAERSGDGVRVGFELPFQIAADAIRRAIEPLTDKNWPPEE